MITLAEALVSGHGTERTFTCPVHPDNHPSARVNVAKGVWFCHVCKSHGTVDGAVYDDLDPDLTLRAVTGRLADPDTAGYPESWLDSFDAAGPGSYWLSRFEVGTAVHFRLGHDAVRDAATYPLRSPGGRLLGVVRRSLCGGSKYRYPPGAKTTNLLFNYAPEQVRTVLLTEGATDAMAAWEAGLHTDADTVPVATFSNLISAAQLALLARIDPARVIVCYDDDEAGSAGAAQVAGLLRADYRVLRAHFGGAKDLADLSPDARIEAVAQAVAL